MTYIFIHITLAKDIYYHIYFGMLLSNFALIISIDCKHWWLNDEWYQSLEWISVCSWIICWNKKKCPPLEGIPLVLLATWKIYLWQTLLSCFAKLWFVNFLCSSWILAHHFQHVAVFLFLINILSWESGWENLESDHAGLEAHSHLLPDVWT